MTSKILIKQKDCSFNNNIFSINLDYPLNDNYYVSNFICNNTFYNVNDTNNQFTITSLTIPLSLSLTLTEGFYSGTELSQEIETQIGNSFTCDYNSITHKFTITSPGINTFYITYPNLTETSKLLGINSLSTPTNIKISDYPIDITFKNIYIKFYDDLKSIYSKGNNIFSIILFNNIYQTNFGELFVYSGNEKDIVKFENKKNFTFSFVDSNNNFINMYNSM